jgi:poly(glycerol-phosphate) alpha-glucosyltransferase
MAVLEALAHGLPALLTPQCNIPHARSAGAALIRSPDAAALTDGLGDLLSRPPERLAEMGRRGKELVRRKFLWSQAADRMREVYEWLLGRRNRPDCVMDLG